MNRLTLIGYRASGKSTIGRLVAARLAWPFIDADHVVEQRIKQPISTYFATHGEAAFRAAEHHALRATVESPGAFVLATGGGAVLREDNRTLLSTHGGLVIYLDVPVALLQERLRHNTGGRPSLSGLPVADEVPTLHAQRDPLYRAVAHVCLRVDGTAAQATDLILHEIAQR